LNRSRSTEAQPEFGLDAKKSALTLRFPKNWFEANPLTLADLEEEKERLRAVDVTLEIAVD
ncbi:MAG TPA: hypothetical protein VF103_02580, partial [Polyangiaceae bacterium]